MSSPLLVVGAAPSCDAGGFYRTLVRAAGSVVAADGGAAVCRTAGRLPDVCVGDLDSIDVDTLAWLEEAAVQIRRFPVGKDASDLDLALDVARELGAERVEVTAAFSGRIDHTLAAFGTLVRAADLGARALEPGFTAYPLDARSRATLDLAEAPGTTISLFALCGSVVTSISGVRYPLDNAPLPVHTSLGLSNVAVAGVQHIEVGAGQALCIVSPTSDTARTVLPASDSR